MAEENAPKNDDQEKARATSGPAASPLTTSAPPDEPVRMKTQASSTTASDEDTESGDVELYMLYPQDVFRFGDGPDDELVGHNAKKFTQSEATRIRELAAHNNVMLLERKPEGDNS